MSDKEIVESLALIKYLLPGDLVIADRGFTGDSMSIAVMKTPHSLKEESSWKKWWWIGDVNYLAFKFMLNV